VLIEDAAQALLARREGQSLGGIAPLAAISFHETKNVIAGEGGALLINDERFLRRAEIVWEKGTDRSRFLRGQVDKYTWQDIGSSYQPSEITAAFLWPQLEDSASTTATRMAIWNRYHAAFGELERAGVASRPFVPETCEHNAHLYYLLLANPAVRQDVLTRLNAAGVNAIFHYVPLHRSTAGQRFGRVCGDLRHTDRVSDSLIRLPLWAGMPPADVDYVVEQVYAAVSQYAA
jgi:dTDP-4-amino-4,6-dideoxygalactose transaminase